MDIYYKCPCCNKKKRIINPLTLGSGWQNEMYKSLEAFLKTWQDELYKDWDPKKPRLEMSLDGFENEPKKIPQSIQKVYVPPKERGKPEKPKKPEYTEPLETVDPTWKLWGQLSTAFLVGFVEDGTPLTESVVKIRIGEWTQRGFTRLKCKEWLKVGLSPGEAHLASFCEENLVLEPDEVLEYMSYDEIVKLYNQQYNIGDEKDDEEADDQDTDL